MNLPERIVRKFTHDESGCWVWTAYKNDDGYGVVWDGNVGKTRKAHQVLYELAKGPIPDGLEIDHLCSNRACINPDHLEAVAHLENVRRGTTGQGGNWQKDKTVCPQGHPYSVENTYAYPPGSRQPGGRKCRTCHRIQQRRYKATRR